MIAAGTALAKRLLYRCDARWGKRGKRLTHIRKSAGRQPHSSRAHDRRPHHQQIRMRILHTSADLMYKRQDDQRSNSVGDERRNDEDQRGEDDENAVEAHALDFFGDGARDGVQ